MSRFTVLFGVVAALACLPPAALAQWLETFEPYPAGSGMHGRGGWKGWDNDPAFDALVTTAQAHGGSKSVDIVASADLVHEFCGCTFGLWTFTAWQYVPTNFSGSSYFILLNTYNDGGPYNWSTQLEFDSVRGVVESEFENTTLPLITGRWVELRVEIDLDLDTQTIHYDGVVLSTKSWTDGVSGNGAVNIGAVDLFANGATSVYYDDLSLVPDCLGDLDNDDQVGLSDLAQLLAHYGMVTGVCYTDGDLDFDVDVDLSDLAALLSEYGTICP